MCQQEMPYQLEVPFLKIMRPRTAHSSYSSSRRTTTASNARPFTSMTASRAVLNSNHSPSHRPKTMIGSTAHGNVVLPSQTSMRNRPMTAGLASSIIDTSNRKELNGNLVQDASYFENLVKLRMRDLRKEIEKVRNETINTKKMLENHDQLKHLHDQTQRHIHEMKCQMSDFNTALELMRNGVDIEEMERSFFHIKERNEISANELDQLFLLNRRKQDELEECKKKLEVHKESIIEIIENANENEKSEFEELTNELQDLRNEESELRNQIDSTFFNLDKARIQLENRSDKEKYIRYEEEKKIVKELEEKMALVEEDLRLLHLNDSDIHTYFIDKVKQEKNHVALLCEELKEMEVTKAQLNQEIDGKKVELSKLVKQIESCQKDALHEVYLKSENARKSAMESEESIKKLNDDIDKKRSEISQLEYELNEIRDDDAPSKEGLMKLKEDSEFHMKELSNSQFTLEKLLEEKERRSKELDQLNEMGEKIEAEEKQIIDSITEMEDELESFEDHENLQRQANDTIASLKSLRDHYETQIYILNPKVTALARKLEDKKNLLNKSQTFHTLKQLEDKISRQTGIVTELNEFIKTKGNELQYSQRKQECLNIAREINSKTIDIL